MGALFWSAKRAGWASPLPLFGALLAASTGIVGATVVYNGANFSTHHVKNVVMTHPLPRETIAASGTLGQIIPPSIVLVLFGRCSKFRLPNGTIKIWVKFFPR